MLVFIFFFFFFFFFFKQKTAYEITEGDWSSDVCSSDLNGAKQDPHPTQGLRPPAARQVCEPDRGDRPADRRDHHRARAPAHREERLLRDPQPVQGQGLARALRGAHAQTPDRHPLADPEDRRLADAARPPGRRRHRDQAVKGIVGTKLGMTQLFDPETGEVTPVTVIEAGPCPVVQVKTMATDGYEAVQLAFDATA